jgi:hypothetical protein
LPKTCTGTKINCSISQLLKWNLYGFLYTIERKPWNY